jgi:microbial collagenase
MFEKQPQQVGQILGYFRPGNYGGDAGYLQSNHDTHDGDWNTWLSCLHANQGDTATCGGTTTPPPPTNPPPTSLPECPGSSGQLADGCQISNVQASRAGDSAYFYVYLPAGTSSLQITTGGGDGNADLYVSGRGWPSTTDYDQRSIGGSNTESVSITPRATAGYYFVAVVAKAPYSGVVVSASFDGGATPPPPAWPECTGNAAALASGCQHSHVEATRAGDTRYFYMLVSGGSTSLHVETAGGTGDADLYVSHRGWPSATDFDQSSVHAGNSESVDIAQPVANTYYYVAVTAKAPYSDVAVRARSTP